MREKVMAYLSAGAREIWLVADNGPVEILDESGIRESSVIGIEFSLPP